MDHQVPEESSNSIVRPRPRSTSLDQVPSSLPPIRNNNIVDQQGSTDKLTPLLKLGDIGEDFHPGYQPEAKKQSPDDGFQRQHGFTHRDMELELDTDENENNEEKEQMEIRDEEESAADYGEDFQFFHHKLLLQQHLGGHNNEFGGVNSFGSQNGHVNMGSDAFHFEGCDDNGIGNNFSENPFVFPDGVMEYGEPQFFPGNCVGYLETILEETDEEFEEEEGCSGRHWWTADSDTDTDSVIRVDNGHPNQKHSTQQLCNNNNQAAVHAQATKNSKLKSVDNVEDLSEIQSTFRTSASSRPFELEDLHLLDQLDLAFEETLMEPRRRSGFAAFGHQLHLLDQPLEKHVKLFHHEQDDGRSTFLHRDGVTLKRSASHDGERTVFSSEDFILPQTTEKNISAVEKVDGGGGESRVLGNGESKETFGSSLSPSSSDSEPHEVAEEDFFYSSPESEEADGASSSDDSEKNGSGVVLAEFSLSAATGDAGGFGGNNNSFSSGTLFGGTAGSGRNGVASSGSRRSLESSKLKSFRSFDSLNSLSGTELLFSKADTFPSFHYIKEDVEPSGGSSGPVSPTSSPRCNLTSCSTSDVPRSTGCDPERRDASSGMRGEGEGESQSLPLDHNHHSVPGFPPTFNINKKTASYSSSTTSTTSTSSCNSATGMIHSSENLSEDSGIGPEGGSHPNAMGEKRSSAESFSDDLGEHQEPGGIDGVGGGESAKDYISKSEFALNPLVFSSLSSASDGGSNSPSINSVPSLNNHESSPSADFSGSELNGNQRCVTTGTAVKDDGESMRRSRNVVVESSPSLVEDETRMGSSITHNSLSNFHQEKVDEKDSSQIESPQSHPPQLGNNKKEVELGTISSSIPFEHKLPISINDQTKPNKNLKAAVVVPVAAGVLVDAVKSSHHLLPASPTISSSSSNHNGEHQHCSIIKPNPTTNTGLLDCPGRSGLHPYSDPDLRICESQPNVRPEDKADEAKALSNFADNITSDNPNSTTSTSSESYSVIDTTNPNVPFDPESQSQKTSLSFPPPQVEGVRRNHPDQSKNSRPSLATESHNISSSNYNDDNVTTPTLVQPQQRQLLEGEDAVVGVQVPYSPQGIKIEEGHMKPASVTSPPPPPYGQGGCGLQMADCNQVQENNDTPVSKPSDHISIVDDTPKTRSSRRGPLQRERSNSESEFECAESAVELDSIALAYAIVNSPTKLNSGSSSPTTQLNPTNIGHGDNLNGESGAADTHESTTLMNRGGRGEDENRVNDGMQIESHTQVSHSHSSQQKDEQKIVDVVNIEATSSPCTPHKVFTSPLLSSHDESVMRNTSPGQSQSHAPPNGSSVGNNSIELSHCWPATATAESSGNGLQNAKISLHHHQSDPHGGGLVVDGDHVNINQSEISTTVPPPQNKALGQHQQQEDNGIKPSRSVNSGYSSSVDVDVGDHSQLQGLQKLNNYQYEPPPTSYSNLIKDKSGIDNSSRVSSSSSDEEVVLVAAAKPIHPQHIGVAEVKKFSQFDSSSAVRKLHHPSSTFHPSHPLHHHHQTHQHYHGLGDSESENIIRIAHSTKSKSCTDGGYTSKSKTEEEEAILGQSNFGPSSHPRNRNGGDNNPPTLDSKSCNLVSASVKSTLSTDSSSESTEFPSYGFPSSHSSYPPNSFLTHSEEGDHSHQHNYHHHHHGTEISREKTYKKQHRDPLHLEDINCGGIHPQQFTIPFGVLSAAVLAVAPSLPSKRLVFLNETDSSELTHTSGSTTTSLNPTSTTNNIPVTEEGISNVQTEKVFNKVLLETGQSKPSSSANTGNTPSNPLNGVGLSLTNSLPVTPLSHPNPNHTDVFVVKQTHSSSSPEGSASEEGDKESQKETEVTQTGLIHPAMEVDSNTPNGSGNGSRGSAGAERRSTSPSGPIPIKTRTYGPRNEVEVVLMSRNSRTPSPAPAPGASFPFSSSLKHTHPSSTTTNSSSVGEDCNREQQTGSGGSGSGGGDPPVKVARTRVHFSPIVNEISWRESYIDQNEDTEDIVSSGFGESGQVFPENYEYYPGSASYGESGFGDSLVRPLQVPEFKEMAEVFNNPLMEGGESPRQTSPGPGKGPILVEKVQMRSSFLSGDDEVEVESDEDLERKLTMDVHVQDSSNANRARSPVDEDHLEEDYLIDGPRKEGMTFNTSKFGASSHQQQYYHQQFDTGVLDLYEDVNVAIEPQLSSGQGSTNLSMMPDLLSQCENAAHAQTHIDVCIEEQIHNYNGKPPIKPKPLRNKSHSPTPQDQRHSSAEIPPPPMMDGDQVPHNQPPQQQQIFPKIFAEEPNGSGKLGKVGKSDSKNNSSSSLNKKKSSKGFGLGSGSKKNEQASPKERDNKEATNKEKKSEVEDASKENKTSPSGKGSKPGFFERLSKIRLSGSKPKKQKVHPKMDELQQQPLKSQNAVNFNGSSTTSNGNNGTKSVPSIGGGQGNKLPSQPILKKTQHTPVIPNYTPTDYDTTESEPAESHQAFENILDEIAGIENIKMRMGKSSSETTSGGGTPERVNPQQPPPKEMRSFAKRKQFYSSATESSSPSPPISPNGRSLSDLDRKLSEFKADASKNRVVISKSHPDLELIEDMVRQASSPEPQVTTKSTEEVNKPQQRGKSPESKKSPKKSHMSETGQKNEREWYKLLKSAAEKYYYRGSKDKDVGEGSSKEKTKSFTLPSGHKTGIVETDLDTGTSREMLDAELVELDRKYPLFTASTSEIPSSIYTTPITTMAATSPGTSTKTRSLTNLSTRLPLSIAPSSNFNYDDVDHLTQGELNEFDDERAKSYEFLLDDNQKSASVPPENKLRAEPRQLSQHELSVQKSLQRIEVPEWYKKHEAANNAINSRTSTPDRPYSGGHEKTGTLKLLNRRSEYGSSGGLAGGWAGLSAFKAPSMSSLQNVGDKGRYAGSLNRNSNFVRGRPTTMSSRESLNRTGSASHSPSAYDARSSFTYGIVPFTLTRFGHGRMSNNSGTVTPTSTAESNASTTNPSYVKKPYLGWRSQERLNQQAASGGGDGGPPKLSVFLPVEERLAADLLRTRVPNKPPISDRPPLPKRSEKTSLTKPSLQSQTKTNNSIPPPNFDDSLPTEHSTFTTTNRVGRGGIGRSPNVHDSIRQVTEAISQYVEKGEEHLTTPPKPQPRKKSPGRQAIWMESSFVGTAGRKPANK